MRDWARLSWNRMKNTHYVVTLSAGNLFAMTERGIMETEFISTEWITDYRNYTCAITADLTLKENIKEYFKGNKALNSIDYALDGRTP